MTRPGRTTRRQRGLSMVEVVVSILIVGVMAAAAMRTIGAARMAQYRVGVRSHGQMLAQDLMSEVLAQAYAESSGSTSFGRESGESATSRAKYDDVDDYHGWSASPPQTADGQAHADLADFTRSVTVVRVKAAMPDQSASSDTGVKRITITVRHRGLVVAELDALKCDLPAEQSGGIITDLLEALP